MAGKKKGGGGIGVDPALLASSVAQYDNPAPDVPATAPAMAPRAAPAADEAPITMYDPQGAAVNVPASQARGLYLSGQLGFADGQDIHVKQGGKVYKVGADDASSVMADESTQFASHQDVADAHERKEYGGAWNATKAFGAGVGRGLTFGGTDLAARAIGGSAAADELAKLKKHHAIASGVGEIAGAVAPVLLTGGAAAPEEAAALGAARGGAALAEGASAARGLGSTLAGGVRAAGALPRGLASAGSLAARGAEKLVGTEATTLAGRLAQRAVPMAVQGGVEGAGYGAGAEISEEALGDHDLNAEKLIAAAGHGALFGGTVGGVLGAGEVAAKAIGDKAFKVIGNEGLADWLDSSANNRVFKAIGGDRQAVNQLGKGAANQAEKAGERIQSIGDEIRSYHYEDGERLFNPGIKGQTTEELGERITRAVDEQTKRLDAVRQRAYKVTGAAPELAPDVAGFLGKVDEIAAKAASTGLESDINLGNKLAKEFGGLRAKITPPELPPELEQLRAANPEALERLKAANPDLVAKLEPQGASLEDLVNLRKRLDEKIYHAKAGGGVQAPDVTEHAQNLVAVRRELENTIEAATEKAANATGDASLIADLKDAKSKLSNLIPARDIANKWTNAELSRRLVSPSDHGIGLGTMIAGAAHGVGALGSAAMGAAAGAANQYLRHRGSSIAAGLADKLAAISAVRRATASVDDQIAKGVESLFTSRPVSSRLAAASAYLVNRGQDRQRVFADKADEIHQMADNPAQHFDKVASYVAPIAEHAPLTAAAVASKAATITANIAANTPRNQPREASLTPHLDQRRVSEADMAKSARYTAAALKPMSVFADMRGDRLSTDAVRALKDNHPGIYTQIRTTVIEKCADQKKPVPYEKRIQMGKLFGFPADPSQTPAFKAQIRAMYAKVAPKPAQAGAPAHGGRSGGAPPRHQMTRTASAHQTGLSRVLSGTYDD